MFVRIPMVVIRSSDGNGVRNIPASSLVRVVVRRESPYIEPCYHFAPTRSTPGLGMSLACRPYDQDSAS
jgi:hypothetical protein